MKLQFAQIQAKRMDKLDNEKKMKDNDPNASVRKSDHINLAFNAQVTEEILDNRFFYEPLLSAHPLKGSLKSFLFLGKTFKVPLWVSSMTGGTQMAKVINHNLARACHDFGFGMGLGSCRSLLYEDTYLSDFNVRSIIGDDQSLYANLGIAQLEQLIIDGEMYRIKDLVDKLQADGLIIHINPMQEWLQPEGDRFSFSPLQTIETILEKVNVPIIVKEVGQGFGYESLRTLYQLPLEAVDFAASGGTNFALLELLRSDESVQNAYNNLTLIGHSAEDMVQMSNQIIQELGNKMLCKQVIISGGIKNFLDGYYLTNKINLPAVYGQASGFLRHAQGKYDDLYNYIDKQINGLELANAYLRIRT